MSINGNNLNVSSPVRVYSESPPEGLKTPPTISPITTDDDSDEKTLSSNSKHDENITSPKLKISDLFPPIKESETRKGGENKMTYNNNNDLQKALRRKKKKRTVLRNKWVCDKCHVASFTDYEEACKHELTCTGVIESTKLTREVTNELVETSITTSSSSDDNKKGKDMNPPSTSDDQGLDTEAVVVTKKKAKDINCNSDDKRVSKTRDQAESNTKRNDKGRNINPLSASNDKGIEKTLARKKKVNEMKSKTNNREVAKSKDQVKSKSKQNVIIFSSHNDDHELDEGGIVAKKKVKDTNSNSEIGRVSKAKLPVSSKTKQNQLLFSSKVESKKGPSLRPKVNSARKKKKKIGKHQITAAAPSKSKPKQPLASIFQVASKQKIQKSPDDFVVDDALLVEHRVAEAALQRKKERQLKRERERTEMKSNTNIDVVVLSGDEDSGGETEPHHQVKYPKRHKRMTSSKQMTENQTSSGITTVAAPKFPYPSHVIGDMTLDEASSSKFLSSYQYDWLLQMKRYQSGCREVKEKYLDSVYSPPLDSSSCNDCASNDLLHLRLSSILQPCVSTLEDENTDRENNSIVMRPWTEKHAIQNVPDDVCGIHNQRAALELLDFLNEWKDNRNEIISSRARKRRDAGKRKVEKVKKFKDDDSDFELWDDDSDDEYEGLCKIFLLTGPTGCGKTNLVHAAAKSSNCSLLEINTTSKRGGSDLKKALEESTQSHTSFSKSKKGNKIDAIAVPMVLIDEVDLLFEEDGDTGFWQSLGSVAKKARCPIILTSTTIPEPLTHSESIHHLQCQMTRPESSECARMIELIAKKEGMIFRHQGNKRHQYLESVASLCNCDLRKITYEMQLFSNGSCKISSLRPGLGEKNGPDFHLSNPNYEPKITSITPNIVSSKHHSFIKIEGEHFLLNEALECLRLDVMIGNQKCSKLKQMEDGTILAICPPRIIPAGVNDSGCYIDTFQESLSCRYAPVVVKFHLPNGRIVRSTTPSPLVTYHFEEQQESKDSFTTDDLSIEKLLDGGITSYTSTSSKTVRESNTVHPMETTELSTNTDESSMSEDMMDLAKMSEMESDATLLEDFCYHLNTPELSGSIRGFGTDLLDSSTQFESKNCFEKIVCNDWNDSSFFFGATETYMTRPQTQRDRYLAALTQNASRGMSTFQSSCAPTEDNEKGRINDVQQAQVHSQSEEDCSLVPISCADLTHSLPNLLRCHKDSSEHHRHLDEMNLHIIYRKQRNLGVLLEVSKEIVGEYNFRHHKGVFGTEYFDQKLMLDYVPKLCNMAWVEEAADKQYKIDLEKNSNRLQQTLRRRTRSSPKGREHYFDVVMSNKGGYHDGQSPGKILAERLARCGLR